MRWTALIGLVFILGCSSSVEVQTPPAVNYKTDLTIKLLACNYQIKCGEGGVCIVKWKCPSSLTEYK